jgi:hypothetical protein
MTYAAHHPDASEASDSMIRELMASMTPEDKAMLDRFSKQPVSAKFGQISAALNPLLARWGQDLIRDQGDRLTHVVQDAMAPYLASGKKKP